jgi:hypothetical protein
MLTDQAVDIRRQIMPTPFNYRSHACRTLGCAALFFAAAQLALALAIDGWLPELRDPVYGQKLRQLRRLRADTPHDRLVVMLGSSRTVHGFDAELFRSRAPGDGHPQVVYNFGIPGGGPLTQLLTLRRLLAAGIHPDAVIVELMPVLLVDEAMTTEASHFTAARLSHDELALVARFAGSPADHKLWPDWLANWYAPAYVQRLPIKRLLFPDLVPREGHEHLFAPYDAHGGVVIPDALRTPQAFEHALDIARRSYETRLADLRPGPLARLAFDQLLSLCQEHEIATTLVIMPEGKLFRSWYAPSAWPNVERFVSELSREHRVALVDAHEWCDEAGFLDSHHLLCGGARTFSQRLAESGWTRSFPQLVARRTPIHSP